MRVSAAVAIVFLLSLSSIGASQAFAQAADAGHRGGRFTVVFKSGTLPPDASARVKAAGGVVQESAGAIGVLTASGDAAFAAKLASDASVLAVGPEKSYSLPKVQRQVAQAQTFGSPTAADAGYGFQWDIRRVGAPAMWARVPLEVQHRATVAVLDVGVMYTHPDLTSAVVSSKATNYCVEAGLGAYPVYTKLIDFDAHPEWDPSMGCTPADVMFQAHGTHVAGTIAAQFGGGAVVGVAPGVRIAAYKVFDRFRYTAADGSQVDDVGAFDGPVFVAIVDAALHGDAVINLSLGGTIDRSNKDDNASWLAWNRVANFANRMGTVIVAAAGNDAENSNGSLAHVPSDLPTVVSVSATGTSQLIATTTELDAAPGSDVLAFYSNYGGATDVSAPGGDCGPTFPAGCDPYYWVLNDGIGENPGDPSFGQAAYYFMAGTSMAAPHVSAVAAVIRALHPTWTPGDVRAYLKSTAEPLGSRQLFGHGLVNADAASR